MPYDQRRGNSTRGRGRQGGKGPYQRQYQATVRPGDDKPPKATELPELPGNSRTWDNRLEQALLAKDSLDHWEKFVKTRESLFSIVNLRDAPGGSLLMVRLETVKNEANSKAKNIVAAHFAGKRKATEMILQTLESRAM